MLYKQPGCRHKQQKQQSVMASRRRASAPFIVAAGPHLAAGLHNIRYYQKETQRQREALHSLQFKREYSQAYVQGQVQSSLAKQKKPHQIQPTLLLHREPAKLYTS